MSTGKQPQHPVPPWAHAISGSVAGGVATVALHPLDLLKTRLQVQDGLNLYKGPRYNGLAHAIRSIFMKEGLIGFYKGLSPNVIGSSSSWGIYFFAYRNSVENNPF
jgi:solute carrier family 25 folate transporter 32